MIQKLNHATALECSLLPKNINSIEILKCGVDLRLKIEIFISIRYDSLYQHMNIIYIQITEIGLGLLACLQAGRLKDKKK